MAHGLDDVETGQAAALPRAPLIAFLPSSMTWW